MFAKDTLKNRRVLLGVTGGIAAYKSAELVRRLKDNGADVRVVMTKGAQEFITPMTMQALSSNSVGTDLLDPAAEAAMGHIELAKWADAILIAPATASFISRMTVGAGSDLLSTLCLATQAPIFVAPAMNQAMWHNIATQENMATIKRRGISVIGPGAGEQACGDVGLGRMLDVPDIIEAFAGSFGRNELAGQRVLITAGPTREAIDPVRYISNHSSGKMGYALAEAAAKAGAEVTVVSGPVALAPPMGCRVVYVESAQQMLEVSQLEVEQTQFDLFIATAAVADYRPAITAQHKIKKQSSETMSLEMVKNQDILATLAASSRRPSLVVGFAAETQDVEAYARKKLDKKALDVIVANDVSSSDIGFNADDNAVLFITAQSTQAIPKMNKRELAEELIARLSKQTKV